MRKETERLLNQEIGSKSNNKKLEENDTTIVSNRFKIPHEAFPNNEDKITLPPITIFFSPSKNKEDQLSGKKRLLPELKEGKDDQPNYLKKKNL